MHFEKSLFLFTSHIIAGVFCQRRQNAPAMTVAMLTHDCEVDN